MEENAFEFGLKINRATANVETSQWPETAEDYALLLQALQRVIFGLCAKGPPAPKAAVEIATGPVPPVNRINGRH